jgi:hypothetical protein
VTGTEEGAADPFAAGALPVDGPDELAGVVDLFGALTPAELVAALVELAYRRGDGDDESVRAAAGPAVAWAVDRYYLVAYAPAGDGTDAGAAGTDDAGDAGAAENAEEAEEAGAAGSTPAPAPDPVDAADLRVALSETAAGSEPAVPADGDAPAGREPRLTVGPVAFPALPAAAEDLPHILDYDTRSVSRAALARAVEERLRGDAARAVAADDADRIRHLFDVTYDLETWAPVDVAEVRERLSDALAALDADADPE